MSLIEPAAPPWYRWHWQAFNRSTRGWSFIERAIYRELLDVQWQEGAIPKDPEKCRRMTGCSTQQWAEAWPNIEDKFPLASNASAVRQNVKMAHERARALLAVLSQIEAGRRGGLCSAKQRLSKATLEGSSSEKQADIDLRSRGKIKTKRQDKEHTPPSNGGTQDAQIDMLKSIFPPRAGSHSWPRAFKAINARLASGSTWQQMLDGAQRYRDYCAATDSIGTQFVKQAATFFGPDKHFDEPWQIPQVKAERLKDRNIQASQDWLKQTSDDRH